MAAEAVAAVGAGAEVGEGVGVKVVEGAHPVLAAQVAAAAGAAEVARAAEAAAVTAVAANWLYPCRSSKREPHTQGPRKRSSKGCGHFLIYLDLREAILIDLVPELFPPAFGMARARRLKTICAPSGVQRMPEQHKRCLTSVLHAASVTPEPIGIPCSRLAGIMHLM